MHRKKHVHTDFCNCLSSKKEKFILENLSRIVEFTRNEGNFDDLVKSLYILGNKRKERILLAGLSLMYGKIFFLTNEINFDEIVKECEEEKSIRPLVSYLSSIAPNEITLLSSSYDIYRFLQPPSEEWTNLITLVINYVAQGKKANIYRDIGYPYCCEKPNKKDAVDFWEAYSDYASKQSSYSVFGLKDYMDWAEFFYWWRNHLAEEYGLLYQPGSLIINLRKICAKRLQKRDLGLPQPKTLYGSAVFYPKYFLENLLEEIGYEENIDS